jgi:hypothetical protein
MINGKWRDQLNNIVYGVIVYVLERIKHSTYTICAHDEYIFELGL